MKSIFLWYLFATGLFSAAAIAQEQPPPVTAMPVSGEPEELQVNFRGVPLDTFLEFLSEKAGFIINKEVEVEGTVDIWSHQPLNREEMVSLLITVLNQKGFTALRNERLLTIVPRDQALQRDVPVKSSSDPAQIPKNDEMVTQIIPVRHADAVKLLENLRPLIPTYANASANESSNAIILTDVQVNVHRIAQIVQTLDTSISSISSVRVFWLTVSRAESVADVINKLFEAPLDEEESNNAGRRFFGRMGGGGGPGGSGMFGPAGGGGGAAEPGNSAAREATTRVVAVADERTNSVVVAAPEDVMPTVAGIVEDLESTKTVHNEVRVFMLKNSDAEEMAELIEGLFGEQEESNNTNTGGGGRGIPVPFFGRGGGLPGGGGGAASESTVGGENVVLAEADLRTNSVVVSAPAGYMEAIAATIERIDRDTAKKQKVFVYQLNHADPEAVAAIIQNMFQSEGSSTTQSTRATSNRSASSTGNASSNQQSQGTGFGGGTGGQSGFGN